MVNELTDDEPIDLRAATMRVLNRLLEDSKRLQEATELLRRLDTILDFEGRRRDKDEDYPNVFDDVVAFLAAQETGR